MAEYFGESALNALWSRVKEEDAKHTNVFFVSYVGTGKYDVNNPCSVTFPVAPKVVFWFNYDLDVTTASNDSNLVVFRQGATSLNTGNSSTYTNPATWSNDGKTVSWYNTVGAGNQWNLSGKEYLMVALA